VLLAKTMAQDLTNVDDYPWATFTAKCGWTNSIGADFLDLPMTSFTFVSYYNDDNKNMALPMSKALELCHYRSCDAYESKCNEGFPGCTVSVDA
jgi:hypothetical protein